MRVFNGTLAQRRPAALRAGAAPTTTPRRSACASRSRRRSRALGPGEVGYLIAGIKDVGEAQVGETVTTAARPAAEPLEGYRDPKPMVFCGLYPVDGDEYADLREALEKLRLNDSSFTYEPETSGALGFGFRCGFLGLLHMEIIRERLEREYDLVARRHRAERRVPRRSSIDGQRRGRRQPVGDAAAEPDRERSRSRTSRSPMLTPTEYIGTLMELRAAAARRDEEDGVPVGGARRARLRRCRSAEIVMDFFDQLKSRTRGYASLDYEPAGYRRSEPRRRSTCCSTASRSTRSPTIVHRDKAYDYGRRMTEKLRELIPRQLFDVPDPGRDRRAHHRPRDGEGEAQGRASPSATAVTSRASASCSSGRRKARSG